MKTEFITLNEERKVTLTAYLQEAGGEFGYISKRPAILILPGGGYQYCSDREADPVAMPYLKAGYQVFILRYSVKEHSQWPKPLEDWRRISILFRQRSRSSSNALSEGRVSGFYSPLFCKRAQPMAKATGGL